MNSLIDFGNIGNLANPVNTLIEKCSQAIGACCEPWQIRRVVRAKAEAEAGANLIRAEGEIKVQELQERALIRFVTQESIKQQNIESIIRKALSLVKESAKPENINNDWLFNFFNKCSSISDDNVQTIWSSILAGEANRPGSFSRRTVNFLDSIDQNDAKLFVSLCSFCWYDGKNSLPLIYNLEDKIYAKENINFTTLQHLDDIGFLSFNDLSGYKLQGFRKVTKLHYYGNPFVLTFDKEENNELNTGKVILSQVGQELAPICSSKPINEFPEYVFEQWKKHNINVQRVQNNAKK